MASFLQRLIDNARDMVTRQGQQGGGEFASPVAFGGGPVLSPNTTPTQQTVGQPSEPISPTRKQRQVQIPPSQTQQVSRQIPNRAQGARQQAVNVGEQVPSRRERIEPQQSTAQPIGSIMDFYAQQLGSQNPARNNLQGYFPVLNELPYLMELEDQYNRPGLGTLLALQALYESTGGRATSNLFGVKPGGNVSEFASPRDAIDFQLSESVLGGGANPAMNILDRQGTITPDEIRELYRAYDPPGAYINDLLEAYKQITGIQGRGV